MAGETDRKFFINLIGWALMIASKTALLQFLISLNFLQFWTFQWFISMVFIVGLFSGGLGILNMGKKNGIGSASLVFGNFYLIVAILIYLFMGFYQSAESLPPAPFFGSALLGTVCAGLGYYSLRRGTAAYLRFPAYGFGIAGVLYVFQLMHKYVFYSHPFHPQVFSGEIFLILVGGGLFFYFYTNSDEQV